MDRYSHQISMITIVMFIIVIIVLYHLISRKDNDTNCNMDCRIPLEPCRNPHFIVNPRKLEHGFRTISAGISYTLP